MKRPQQASRGNILILPLLALAAFGVLNIIPFTSSGSVSVTTISYGLPFMVYTSTQHAMSNDVPANKFYAAAIIANLFVTFVVIFLGVYLFRIAKKQSTSKS